MEGEREHIVYGAIVVTTEELTYLHQQLVKTFPIIVYRAVCNDGMRLTFASFDELVAYENPDTSRITELRIIANHPRIELSLQLGYNTLSLARAADMTLRFTDLGLALQIEKDLIPRLKRWRPWYGWIAHVPFLIVVPVLVIYGGQIVLGVLSLLGGVTDEPSSLSQSALSFLGIVFMSLLLLIGTDSYPSTAQPP